MQHIVIDVVSDMVCPWCYLGKARLDLAIAEVQDEIGVDVNWRPYQLNPDYPPQGVDHQKALEQKLGGREKVAQIHTVLTELGAQVGIAYDFEAIRIGPNTLDAHRLAFWARTQSRQMQDKVVAMLFKAHFEEGRNIGDHGELADIAAQAGMERPLAATLLASQADKDSVLAEIDAVRKMGVSGVPLFIIEQKYAVSGAQSREVLIAALRDIAKIKSAEHRALN